MVELDHLSSHIVQQNARLIDAKAKLDAFLAAVPLAVEAANDQFAAYDVRANRLYEEILNGSAEIKTATNLISGAARVGVNELQAGMGIVAGQAVELLQNMQQLQSAIAGENGVAARVLGVEKMLGREMLALDKNIKSLDGLQISKIAMHQKSIANLTMAGVALVSFVAGMSASVDAHWMHVALAGCAGAGIGLAVGWNRAAR